MNTFNELKKQENFNVEILTFNETGDVVLIIDNGKNDKTILSGKGATNLIELVDNYLNELHKKNKIYLKEMHKWDMLTKL